MNIWRHLFLVLYFREEGRQNIAAPAVLLVELPMGSEILNTALSRFVVHWIMFFFTL
jgi:hypothetical protein